MDWAFIGSIVGLVAAVVVAVLQKKGATKAVAVAQETQQILATVIKGIENGTKDQPNLKNVKGYIRAAALDQGVQEVLHGLVKKYT